MPEDDRGVGWRVGSLCPITLHRHQRLESEQGQFQSLFRVTDLRSINIERSNIK